MTPRRQRVLTVVAAIGAVVVLFLFLRGKPPVAAPTPEVAASEPTPTAPTSYQVRANSHIGDGRGPSVARIKAEYEAYKASSIYPDWSYPLTADQDFLLKWNAPVTNDLPVDDNGQVFFRFDADRARVFAGEPYTSWAEAWTTEGGKKKSLPMHFDKATVVLTSGPKMGDAFSLEFHDDGIAPDQQAGDFRYSNRFVPSEHAELAQASSARIEVYVDVDGNKRRFVRDFSWAPRKVLEVVAERDAIEDGSLVATLDCNVLEDGLYTVYGNLFAADGKTPLAMSKKSYPLEKGRQTVKLVFFGKVLNDLAIPGPYVLKDIHGLKRQGQDEYNNIWWTHPTTYTTQAYASDDFSGAEWNDPEHRERLATFERVIAEMEQGAAQ